MAVYTHQNEKILYATLLVINNNDNQHNPVRGLATRGTYEGYHLWLPTWLDPSLKSVILYTSDECFYLDPVV